MGVAGIKAGVSAACATVLLGLVGWGMAGCGYGSTSVVGCGLADTATPGPALNPALQYEFLFVPNALCAPGVTNDVMSVLVINPDGTFANAPVPLVQTGNEPVWAVVDPTNHFVYVTNLADNTVSAFTLNTTNGAMAVVPGSPFPAGTAPGAAAVDPSGKFLYVANDGSNNVSEFKINADGSLTSLGPPIAAGSEPQQGIAVTAGFVYVSNLGSNNVSAYSFDNTGRLTPLPSSPIPLAPALNPQPESLVMDPAGKFLFTANMTSNNVSAFTVNADGSLTQAPGSPFGAGFSSPQYLATDQAGAFLYVVNVANNGSLGSLTAYTIAGSGALTQLGTALSTGNFPEGLAVDKANKFLMVANFDDGTLSVYQINNGSLTALGPLLSNAIIAGPQMVATTH